MANCYKSADHCKKIKIGVPEEYSKLNQVAIQAFKHMNFLDSLEETVTFMERKNILVLASFGLGVATIGMVFAEFLSNQWLNESTMSILIGTKVASGGLSFFSGIFSIMYHQGILQKSYDTRFKMIHQQFSMI